MIVTTLTLTDDEREVVIFALAELAAAETKRGKSKTAQSMSGAEHRECATTAYRVHDRLRATT